MAIDLDSLMRDYDVPLATYVAIKLAEQTKGINIRVSSFIFSVGFMTDLSTGKQTDLGNHTVDVDIEVADDMEIPNELKAKLLAVGFHPFHLTDDEKDDENMKKWTMSRMYITLNHKPNK